MSLDALDLAQALIRCPSVTPEEGGALDTLGRALEGIGFTCHRHVFSDENTPDVDNLYARFGTAAPNFCFAGHTDVVPVGNRDAWTVDPFGGEVIDEKLFGRGASDMKTAVACFAAAASRFVERHGSDFGGSISFLITGDEEGVAINGTRKLLQQIAADGETLDACIVGEPTNPNALGDMAKIGRRGSLTANLTVFGIQGHTAYPHLADNPIHKLIPMLASIISEPLDDGTDHFQPSTVQIASVDADNSASNVIPGKVTALFNIRYNDLHTGTSLTEWLHQQFQSTGAKQGEDYDLAIHVSGDAFLTPPGTLSEVVTAAVEKATGKKPELSTSGGTSDARFIKDYCPVIEFGMVGQTMHKTDEHIPAGDVARLTDIYEAILDAYFGKT